MKKVRLKTILWPVIFLVPFVLGVIGFLQTEGMDWLSSVYSSIKLYFLNVDAIQLNIWLEIARWLALLVMTSSIFMIARTITLRLKILLTCLRKDSTAVYGDSVYAKQLLADLGAKGIRAETTPIAGAQRHILLFEADEQNLDFYIKHKDTFKNDRVVVMLNRLEPHCLSGGNVTAFCVYEYCARAYWKNHPARTNERIGIIGFGALGEALLETGLLLNLFSLKQSVEYHIWGDSRAFRALHTELAHIDTDRIIFHEDVWQVGLPQTEGLDRIILSSDHSENLLNLSKILAFFPPRRIDVYIDSEMSIAPFQQAGTEIVPYGMVHTLATQNIILNESPLRQAKDMHNAYRALYPDIEPWEKLSGFLKRSNISSADYAELVRESEDFKALPEEEQAELEHIRWCRFHYLNNWQYDTKRDNARKKHPCLVPYAQLSEEDKEKDRNNIREYLRK